MYIRYKEEIKMNKDLSSIVSQAFYGNRVSTEIKKENLDRFILGYVDSRIPVTEKLDRTIINIPNTNNIVLIYNKYQEEEKLKSKEELLKKENYKLKPLATIPESNVEIYSRCVVCRMNENGELESLQSGDYEKFVKYLSE